MDFTVHRRSVSLVLHVVMFSGPAVLAACGSDSAGQQTENGGAGGSAGSSGAQSVGAAGGAKSAGGEGDGGALPMGGASAGGSAGAGPGKGGTSSNGGAVSPSGGGTSSTGGAASSTGGANAGGTPTTGGTTGSGGANGGAGGSAGAGGSSGTSLANPGPGSKFFVGANFWNIDWEGQADFFQNNVDFRTTTNPWNAQLLKDLAPYNVLRFMDWNGTNDSGNPQAVWDTRKQKTAQQNQPVAFEWQIDLCNRTKKDYWLNVPHESNADYWTKLANLVKDQLDPSLRLYVEWSNEVWNSAFPANGYAANKAKSLGLSGSMPAASYYVYQSVRLYEAFESIFGKGSPRLVKVLAGQAAWTGPCEAHATALKDKTINPNGTMPTVYAIAPYFSGNTTGELSSSLPEVNKWTSDSKKCADSINVPLISYEGGSDSYAAGSGCTTVQHDAAMHDIYMTYLTGISGAGLRGPFMQYTHTGACWGLKEKTSDSLEASPKYKGVLDWLAAHP